MATTLAQIRAKLQQQESKSNQSNTGSYGDGAVYPHWNMEEGTSVRMRLLPDADPTNSYFWVEKAMIKLEFNGIKGQVDSKKVLVQVPCIEMWPDMGPCPILSEVRPWFKDPSLESLGRKYWKKKSYIFQGFVRENPMKEDKTPENPIRRFIISPQIFNLVRSALMDPELENLPTDYENGLDFIVNKTAKGGYADYTTSKWARKENALTAEEMEAIEKYGLFNLSESLPKRPTKEELDVMVEMFHASVNGESYDGEKWSKYFKPSGYQSAEGGNTNTATDTVKTTSAPAVQVTAGKVVVNSSKDEDFDADDDDGSAAQPVVTPAAKSTGSRAEDILAMIRNRPKTA